MKSTRLTLIAVALSVASAALAVPRPAAAQELWRAAVGAQSKDLGRQAIAFLPNELLIHEGDSVVWSSGSGDIHTVSFLMAGQKFNSFAVGCPGYSRTGSSFSGTSCVSSPPIVAEQEFTVAFPTAGNFSLVCLVHPFMTGVVHVMPRSAVLPHNQQFYDDEAAIQKRKLLDDTDHHAMADMDSARVLPANGVAAGLGEVTQNAAGFQALAVDRFSKGTIEVRVGDTVEWSVLDPADPHTITFGVEPANPGPPSPNVTFDRDGARHVTLYAPGDSANSGIIGGVPENQVGVPQSPATIPVFRVTFKGPGTYNYICALHDTLGMVGKVIVQP